MKMTFSSRTSKASIPDYDLETFPVPRIGENFYIPGESWPATVTKVTYDFSAHVVYIELN